MAFGRSAAACFCAPAPGSLDRRIGGVAYHRSPVFFYIEQEMRKKISRNRSPGRSRALSRRDEGGRVEQPMLAAGEQYNDRNKQAQNGRMPMTKTRKTIAAQLAALCLVAASLPALAQSAQEQQLYEAAKKEGTLTWYSGVLDQALCEKVGKAFTAKYPGIQVDATKTTSQVAFQRLLQDIKAGQVQSDVFTSTDASHLVFLKAKGELVKFVPENADKVAEAFQKIDPDGFYHITWANLASIVYNTDKVKAADAPKNWPDLLDKKWTNQIAVGSPNFSGMVGVWTLSLAKLYGCDSFTTLNPQKPPPGRSIHDTLTLL